MKGQSFLTNINSLTQRYLFIVITDQDEEQNYLIVPITAFREDRNCKPLKGQDKNCILAAGDHPFIKNMSWVCYSKAIELSHAQISNGINKGVLMSQKDIPKKVLNKIQDGCKKTRMLPDEFTRFFRYF